jgi:ribonuclease HI
VIITDFLSTIMAVENRTPTKNPKTQTIRKMLDQEGSRITLLWVPIHKGIPSNEKADQAAKEVLNKNILKEWLTGEDFKKPIFCNTDLSVDHILWECKETEN